MEDTLFNNVKLLFDAIIVLLVAIAIVFVVIKYGGTILFFASLFRRDVWRKENFVRIQRPPLALKLIVNNKNHPPPPDKDKRIGRSLNSPWRVQKAKRGFWRP